jgi:hypothetical protein
VRWSLKGWFALNQLLRLSARKYFTEPVTYACNKIYKQLRVYWLLNSLNFVWVEFKIQFQVPEDTLFVIPSSYAFCKETVRAVRAIFSYS